MSGTAKASATLVIVPIGSGRAEENYRKTLERELSLEELREHGLPDDAARRLSAYRGVAVWGIMPGRTAESLFRRLREAGGGVVVFVKNGRIVLWGRIVDWLRSRELAKSLWGLEEGKTWEYVYFITSVRRCEPGVPWERLRQLLGYNESFSLRGHLVVEESRLEKLLTQLSASDPHEGLLGLLDRLAEETGGCGGGSSAASPRSKYNPYMVLSLKVLEPREFLEVLGRIVLTLVSIEGEVDREEVERVVSDALRKAGLERKTHLADRNTPLLINDLRRLGIIKAGDPTTQWEPGIKAKATGSTRLAATTIRACMQKSCGDEKDCYLAGGSLIVLLTAKGLVPDASEGLARLLAELAGGAVEETAEKLGIGQADPRILERMAETLKLAKEILSKMAARRCAPLLYAPLILFDAVRPRRRQEAGEE